ncbi:MAG: hypothetical protein IT424_16100 [Pirellulales bacterium]|nr:hypothetical protein [Pirellulales bacterium]
MYCAACASPSLVALPRNEPAADFSCTHCNSRYQLKSSRQPFVRRVVDSAYDSMMNAIQSDRTPNLLLLHYDASWSISTLTLIPKFCFSSAANRKAEATRVECTACWLGRLQYNSRRDSARCPHSRRPCVSGIMRRFGTRSV